MTKWRDEHIVEIIAWVVLLALIGIILIYLSRDQPFPEVSRQHGFMLLGLAGLLLISSASPRQYDGPRVAATIVTIVGGLQMVVGAWHMTSSNRDVIIGPMAGILLCIGATALFSDDWDASSKSEQTVAFITLSFLLLLEAYLFFKGMLIGTSAKMWSAAGLRQIQRGLLQGDKGAIGCFERAWDLEEEYINAMSHLALHKIYSHLGNNNLSLEHYEKLQRLGGTDSVDQTWVEAVKSALSALDCIKSEE
ncbi:MAG: hypothetical protein QF831_05185 [Candidatus Thalassarchaeaceae archaeon]|jgi:hypothetical protein|nr:hypothetical protein [Candidatus Thalassarchaeaceae archaeon]